MPKPTILCVDDERLVLTSLRDALTQVLGNHYVIEIAQSGEEALEVIAELGGAEVEIPIIISDQLMPGLKGDELLAKIHATHPKTLTIMLTGQATPEAIGNAVNAANLYRYIAKPWSDTLLIGVVQEALKSYFQDRDLNEANAVLAKVNAELEQKITDRTTALQYRLKLERLIATISTEFINLGVDEVDAGIQSALQRLGEFVQVDRSYLFQFSANGRSMHCTHEWCADGIASQIDRTQALSISQFPWAIDILNRFQVVCVAQVNQLPPEAQAEQAEFIAHQIQSIVCVPIALQRELFGFIGFDCVAKTQAWSDDIIDALRVVGEIVARAIQQQRMEAALRESEAQNRAILTALPDIIILINSEGVYLRSMRTQAEFDIVAQGIDTTGKHISEIIPIEMAQRRLSEIRRVLATGEPRIYDQQIWVRGKLQHEEVRIVKCGDDTALMIIRDMSDRKDAEEALRKSEERWQLAIQGNNDGIWDHDLLTNSHFVSPRCLEILGGDYAEVDTFENG
ncbi:MAG: response regulator [Leptolyngbyaceae cyanobacterium SL_7_1]|nr:response regulator [Leptolyngbyaceae cyanobacterium SL_7_1]